MERRGGLVEHIVAVIVGRYVGGRSKPRPYEETALSRGDR